MNFLEIYLMAAVVILIYMTCIWLVSLWLKNASIVDIFWGMGFVLAAGTYFALAEGQADRKALITILVTLWGLRLSLHILWRNSGKGEDFRYKKWREEEGQRWWWYSFFKVFLLQGVILWIVSAPLLAAQLGDSKLNIFDILGALVWLIGFGFEAIGDWQLASFKAKPTNKGKVMDQGLWRYTRHPNYFGDATLWWGYYLIALAGGGLWTIFSPIIMSYLLMRVSGVALLEKTLVNTKPQYREYVEKTNAFFPGMPRK